MQQDFAAGAMQFGLERAIAGAVGRRQRFIEDGESAVGIARQSFGLSQRNFQQPVEQQNVLFVQLLDAAAHVFEPSADCAARRGRPTLEKHAESAPHRQLALASEPGKLEGVRRGPRAVAAHQFKHSRVVCSNRQRADVGEVRHPRLHAVVERNRAIDLAERPRHYRKMGHCGDAGVWSETERHVVVSTGLEQGERPFEVIPRFAILAGEPASNSGYAAGHAGLGHIGRRLQVAEEGRGVRLHRRQVASNEAADP